MGQWGAISADLSYARYTQQEKTLRDHVWRLRYAKAFLSTDTSLNAQLQWYPSSGQYRSLEDLDWDDETTERALKGQAEINQNIGEDSSVSLYYNWMKSKKNDGSTRSLSLSLNYNWHDIDTSVYASYGRYQKYPAETTVGFNVSIPVSFGSYTTNAGLISELTSRGKDSYGVNVYGSALDDFSLRYDVTAQHTVHGDDSLNASLGYQYNAGEMNLGMVRSGKRRDYHFDTSGSILLHSGGITTGQPLGSASALVDVPGTPGVGVYNQFGSTTNKKGELMVSYMTP